MRGLLAAAQSALLIIALSFLARAAVDPIEIKGSHFFYKTNGSEFFIKGVVYQDGGHFASQSTQIIDPFGDGPTCQRDIAYFLQLGINLVRAYAVDPLTDHSECMQYLADAGIYVLTELSGNQFEVINRTTPQWNYELYDRFTSVVDAFQNYTNVLGFFVGNEVVDETNSTSAAPFVKAAVRDVKSYIKKKGYRQIPVGYATNDYADILEDLTSYLNCGDSAEAIDMLGMNLYSWCGDSSFTSSGYNEKVQQYLDYSVPIFLSEYGCNIPSPRKFTEVQAIYGDNMTEVFSGGIVYQYFHDNANYGLVSVYGETVTTSQDFHNLKTQLASIAPSSTPYQSYNPSNSAQSCPATQASSWLASPTLPPTPYTRLCACMMESLTCISPSSQNVSSISESVSSICSLNATACTGTLTSPASGDYGAYTVCNSTEQASWIFNQYYLSKGSHASICSNIGGMIQKPFTTLASDCTELLKQAGVAGTGTVTSTPNPPSAAATDNSSGSGSNVGGSNTNSTTTITDETVKSGLSTGAKAGIGIGIAAVIIIIAVLAFFLWRAHRTNKAKVAGDAGDTNVKPELADTSAPKQGLGGRQMAQTGLGSASEFYKPPEADDSRLNELEPEQRYEMAANQPWMEPAELPASHGLSEAATKSPIETVVQSR